jgi:hypothetical protein
MPCETIVAIGGDAHALGIDDLDHEMQENENFRDVLTQYSRALLIHSMRLTGCTGLHTLERRLWQAEVGGGCPWLSTCSDGEHDLSVQVGSCAFQHEMRFARIREG